MKVMQADGTWITIEQFGDEYHHWTTTSDGVMVVGLSDFESDGRRVNPAKESGISTGDMILSADGRRVYTNEEFAKAVMNELLENVKFENCLTNEGYIRAMGMKP